MIKYSFIVLALLLLVACNDKEQRTVIQQCEHEEDDADCLSCCYAFGFNDGLYNETEEVCECIGMN